MKNLWIAIVRRAQIGFTRARIAVVWSLGAWILWVLTVGLVIGSINPALINHMPAWLCALQGIAIAIIVLFAFSLRERESGSSVRTAGLLIASAAMGSAIAVPTTYLDLAISVGIASIVVFVVTAALALPTGVENLTVSRGSFKRVTQAALATACVGAVIGAIVIPLSTPHSELAAAKASANHQARSTDVTAAKSDSVVSTPPARRHHASHPRRSVTAATTPVVKPPRPAKSRSATTRTCFAAVDLPATDLPAVHIPASTIPGYTLNGVKYPPTKVGAVDVPASTVPGVHVPRTCVNVSPDFEEPNTTILTSGYGSLDPKYSSQLTNQYWNDSGSQLAPDPTAPGFDEYNAAGFPKNQYVRPYVRKDGTAVGGYWRNSPSDGLPTCKVISC